MTEDCYNSASTNGGEPIMTTFSDFIRNASDEEKEKVYKEVIDKAIERQKTHTSDGCDLSILEKDYSYFYEK